MRDDTYIDKALENWGLYLSQDMQKHGLSSRPAAPPTSKQYRSEYVGLHDSDPYVPPDEEWFEQIQKAMVKLSAVEIDQATILTKKYRDRYTLPKWKVKKARFRLWSRTTTS